MGRTSSDSSITYRFTNRCCNHMYCWLRYLITATTAIPVVEHLFAHLVSAKKQGSTWCWSCCSSAQPLVDPSKASSIEKSLRSLQSSFNCVKRIKGYINSRASNTTTYQRNQERRLRCITLCHSCLGPLCLRSWKNHQQITPYRWRLCVLVPSRAANKYAGWKMEDMAWRQRREEREVLRTKGLEFGMTLELEPKFRFASTEQSILQAPDINL